MKLYKKFAIGVLAIMAIAGGAHAQIIGIDLNNGGPTDQSPGSTDAVGPDASTGWYNQFNVAAAGAPISLTDSTGSAVTGAKFGFTQGGNALDGSAIYNSGYGASGSANSGLTPNQQLFNGGAAASPGGFAQQVVLTNIPYASYTVYVLVGAQDGAVGYPYPTGGYGDVTDFTDYDPSTNTATQGATYWFYGGTGSPIPSAGFSYLQATGTSQTGATQGANYVEFSGLTGANVAFDLTSPVTDGNAGAYITGIEIVDNVAVPEPSTYVLMLGGLVALVGMRRFSSRFV